MAALLATGEMHSFVAITVLELPDLMLLPLLTLGPVTYICADGA
jgi:hypothetical protein